MRTKLRGIKLDWGNVIGVPIDKYMAMFVPSSGLFDTRTGAATLAKESMTVGVIVNCMNDAWYVESEPTGNKTFGLAVYAPQKARGWRSRKPIMSGQGKIVDQRAGAMRLDFTMQTLYDYVRSSPRGDSLKVEGSATNSGGSTTSEVKVVYEIKF